MKNTGGKVEEKKFKMRKSETWTVKEDKGQI